MATNRKVGDSRVRSFTVTDPTLHPKGYTVYCVTAKVFNLETSESVHETVIWKRYNDFKKLHVYLNTLHKKLHRRDEFPEFARAKLFGRFDEAVLEERRQSAEDLLNFIGTQPHLVRSPHFQKFFQGGEMVNPDTEREALRSTEMLTPQQLHPGQIPVESDSASVDSSDISHEKTAPDMGEETGRELIDETVDGLGGVWQFRQEAENVSLNSAEDDDDIANLTDESALSTPLPDADIAFFDPLQPIPSDTEDAPSDKSNEKYTNTWLLSALTACASLEGQNEARDSEHLHFNVSRDTVDRSFPDKTQETGAEVGSQGQHSQRKEDVSIRLQTEVKVPPSIHPDLQEFDPLRSSVRPESPAHIAHSIAGEAGLTPPSPRRSPAMSPSHSSSSLKGLEKSPSKTRLHVERGDYILQAANQICLAQENEANANYRLAFDFFKSGVEILLMGVQEDDNRARRDAVRRKTAYYLMKAEDLYKRYLSNTTGHGDRWAVDSRFSPSVEIDPRVTYLRGSVSDLSNYRVLGIISRVLLVMDKNTESTYVIKVLHKSCTPGLNNNRRPVVPTSCPYMVQLHQYYETDYAVYLLLQHASGGRLWDYIRGYLNSSLKDSQKDILDACEAARNNINNSDGRDPCDVLNVYSGQQVIQPETEQSISGKNYTKPASPPTISGGEGGDSYLGQDECADGYAALFRNNPSKDSERVEFVHERTRDESNNVSLIHSKVDTKSIQDSDIIQKNNLTSPERNTLNVSDAKSDKVKQSSPIKFENELEKVKKPSLEYFSINSVDSDEGVSSIVDGAKREHIDSIPEDSEQCSVPDEPLDGSTVISSAKELISSVDELLASDDINDFNISERDGRHTQPSDDVFLREESRMDPSLCSTPLKIDLGNKDEMSPRNSGSKVKPNDTEICDSNSHKHNGDVKPQIETGIHDRNVVSQNKSPVRSPTSPSATSKRPLFMRATSMEHSDESSLKLRRRRTMSNVFGQLDAEEVIHSSLLPEKCIAHWAAEIITALSTLHAQGLVCGDLRPENILMGYRGHILLTYFSRWTNVDRDIDEEAIELMYAAPEIKWLDQVGPACDWWSLGALLYELLTGKTLASCHPSGINSHTQLYIPDHVSAEARSLLQELLHFNPKERLGSGLNGEEDIRLHPFFAGINWSSLLG